MQNRLEQAAMSPLALGPLRRREILEWLNSPATCKVLHYLLEQRQACQDRLCSGATLMADGEGSVETKTAKLVGIIKGIDKVFTIEVEEFDSE